MPVDVREARDLRVGLHVCPPEREGFRPVELPVRLRVHGRAVRERGRDVHALGGERQVDRLGGGAHREQEAAVPDVVPDVSRHGLLQVGDRRHAQLLRRIRVEPHHLGEPRLAGVNEIELRVLTREILVMQMQPVVPRELPGHDLEVPHLVEGNPGVLQRHRDGVVPRRRVGRHVHGHLRRLLKRHRVHVARFDLPSNGRDPGVVHRLEGHARERRVAPDRGPVRQQERSAAVVQQPLGLDARLHDPVGDAVGLQVIALGVVHGDEQRG